MPLQAQISGRQSLQYAHASGTVSQTVMGLQGDPVPVIIDSYQIPVIGLEIHGLTGIFHVLLHKWAGAVIGLQVSPEDTLADSRLISRKTRHCQIHRPLQHLGIDLLL